MKKFALSIMALLALTGCNSSSIEETKDLKTLVTEYAKSTNNDVDYIELGEYYTTDADSYIKYTGYRDDGHAVISGGVSIDYLEGGNW